jgi:hypothetical protein
MSTEKFILSALSSGRFSLTKHARERMSQRSITKVDIMACGQSAKSVVDQGDDSYKVKGFDEAGDPLSVVCGYDGQTVIITVF